MHRHCPTMFIAFLKLYKLNQDFWLTLQTSLHSVRGSPGRIVSTWKSSSTHGSLISYLCVAYSSVNTICPAFMVSSPTVWENGRKTTHVFVIVSWSWLGGAAKSKVNGREWWCRCCLHRKSTAWVGNKKGNVWTKVFGVWLIPMTLCRNAWCDVPTLHKSNFTNHFLWVTHVFYCPTLELFAFILLHCCVETTHHIWPSLVHTHFSKRRICCFPEFICDFLSIKLSTKSSTEFLASGLAFSDVKTVVWL